MFWKPENHSTHPYECCHNGSVASTPLRPEPSHAEAAAAARTRNTSTVNRPTSDGLPYILQIDWRRLEDPPAQGPDHQGWQDSDGGWVSDDTVVTAFGYSGGGVPGFLNSAFLYNISVSRSNNSVVKESATGCAYEFPGGVCPASEPSVTCSSDQDCRLAVCPGGCTCHGKLATCRDGVCSAGPGADLCWTGARNHTNTSSAWVPLPSAPVIGRQEVGATVINGAVYIVGGFSYSAPYTYADVLRLGLVAFTYLLIHRGIHLSSSPEEYQYSL